MRKRFEQQLSIGQIPIGEVKISTKCNDAFPKLLRGLQELFRRKEYHEQIFNILDDKIMKNKQVTGRKGMDLWVLFVMAQVRLCLNISYDRLQYMANNHREFRQIMGIEHDSQMLGRIEFEYQNIIDNVTLLDDDTLRKINAIIVEMGHDVFKKKEAEPLRLKTDSFVVLSNVHFPTDYNLLFDSARKCLSIIEKLMLQRSELTGWRKSKSWFRELKNLMRQVWQASKSTAKDRDLKLKEITEQYLDKAKSLVIKLLQTRLLIQWENISEAVLTSELDYYLQMLDKHIDLLERRIIKDETIPQSEKVFSVFEPYTEWINKGKQHPNVELGKNVQITTDQYHLIVDFQIMDKEVDKGTVVSLIKRLSDKWKHIDSWSFDKGFYSKVNKQALEQAVEHAVMRKKGKLTEHESLAENAPIFKKLYHAHSAIESNINELEHKGLDRCPDKTYAHFKTYVTLGITAYNLHRIGTQLLREEQQQMAKLKIAA